MILKTKCSQGFANFDHHFANDFKTELVNSQGHVTSKHDHLVSSKSSALSRLTMSGDINVNEC